MKLFALVTLFGMFLGNEAMAQRCNHCTVPGASEAPRSTVSGPVSRPTSHRPGSTIAPAHRLVCAGTDLYNYRRYVHRFASHRECQVARRDARRTGRFCDQGTMFNRRGFIVNTFDSQISCLRRIH